MKHKLYIILLFTFFLRTPFVLAGEMELEIIPLQSRMSEEVIPILSPLVAPGGTITGMNNQLIIKTTPDNLAEIKKVLENLDRPPRRLLITVTHDVGGHIQTREDAISGRYSTGNVSISSKDPGNREKDWLSGPGMMMGTGSSTVILTGIQRLTTGMPLKCRPWRDTRR